MSSIPQILAKLASEKSARQLGAWKSVPDVVTREFNRLLPAVKTAHLEYRDADTLWLSRASGLPLAKQTPPDDGDWILIKSAGAWAEPVRKFFSAIHKPFLGPRPLTTALLGAAFLSLPGAAVGHFLGRNSSPRVRKQLRRRWMLMGALAGAAPGLGWGAFNTWQAYKGDKGPGSITSRSAISAFLDSWPLNGSTEEKQSSFTPTASGANALFLPSIPVDSFNRAVWNDVVVGQSAFGTRDRFGTNEQPMKTPPPVAAAVTGIVSGASAVKGNQKRISPWDVARTAAVTGAKGWLGGLVLGKTLGALADLSPQSQKKLQQIGVWGGILTGAARTALSP